MRVIRFRGSCLVTRIKHDINGDSASEFQYCLHDDAENIVGIVKDDGQLIERIVHDPLGKPTFLLSSFSDEQDTSHVGWQFLNGQMRLDPDTGMLLGARAFYHPQLGRGLPTGAVSVLNESFLNTTAEGFPFGPAQSSIPPAEYESKVADKSRCRTSIYFAWPRSRSRYSANVTLRSSNSAPASVRPIHEMRGWAMHWIQNRTASSSLPRRSRYLPR